MSEADGAETLERAGAGPNGVSSEGFGRPGGRGALAIDGNGAHNHSAAVNMEAAAVTSPFSGTNGASGGGGTGTNSATIDDRARRKLNGTSAQVLGNRRLRSAEQVGRVMPPIRDAVFRRLLAVADLIAAAGALAIVGITSDRGVAAASLASVPLIVVIAKVAGRYDYDEVVLRKSTIDEIPALLGLAAAYTLGWSLVAFLAGVHLELGGAGTVALWATTAALLIIGRAGAR